jgi:hypothetical protein
MLLPAATGTGLAALVTERSAESATCTLTVALLFTLFGSLADDTESVSVIVVPDATFAFTFTTKVKLAVVFAARLPMVQLGGVVAMLHVHPPGPIKETTVVLAGTGSVNDIAVAVAGPLLVTLCVYVILFPAATGFGLAEFVTLKSACVPDATAMFTVTVLLPRLVSRDVVATVAVSVMIVPAVAAPLTVYLAVTVPVEPGGTLELVHATGAEFGQVHVPPAAFTTVTDANVVLAGVASLNVPVLQLLGPEFVTTCV